MFVQNKAAFILHRTIHTAFLMFLVCVFLTSQGHSVTVSSISHSEPTILLTAEPKKGFLGIGGSPTTTGYKYRWANYGSFRPTLKRDDHPKTVTYILSVETKQKVSGYGSCTVAVTAQGSLNSTPRITLPRMPNSDRTSLIFTHTTSVASKNSLSTTSPGTWTLSGTGTGEVYCRWQGYTI